MDLIAIQDILVDDRIKSLLRLAYGDKPFIYSGLLQTADIQTHLNQINETGNKFTSFALFGSVENLLNHFGMARPINKIFGYSDDYDYHNQQIKFRRNFLNHDALMTDWTTFKDNIDDLFLRFGPKIWVRSKSGFKSLTGQIVSKETKQIDLTTMDRYSRIQDDSTVCFAPYKEISPIEWRFWIINDTLVTFSPYSWDKSLILPNNPDSPIMDFINGYVADLKEIGNQESHTIDLVLYNGKPKIVELNSLHSSGFYESNVIDIVEATLRLSKSLGN